MARRSKGSDISHPFLMGGGAGCLLLLPPLWLIWLIWILYQDYKWWHDDEKQISDEERLKIQEEKIKEARLQEEIAYKQKMLEEELQKFENMINEKIKKEEDLYKSLDDVDISRKYKL